MAAVAKRATVGAGVFVALLPIAAGCGSASSESAPVVNDVVTTDGVLTTENVDPFDDLDTFELDDDVDGVLEVYCLLDANGESHAVGAPLALDGFDPDDLPSMQWVHDVIRSSDGSADFIAAALVEPEVDSDLDVASQIALTDNTKTFLFQNKVPLISVETIYPFRTGPESASVLTTYILDDAQQMLTQRWVLDQGAWIRV